MPLLIRQLKDWIGNGRERGNDMQQRLQDGVKPVAAAARTQPLYLGRLLYQLSHWVAQMIIKMT